MRSERPMQAYFFYLLQEHFPYPFELRIRTTARITKTTWTFRMANARFFSSGVCLREPLQNY